MKLITSVVTYFLIVEAFFALADQQVDSEGTDEERLENFKPSNIDYLLDEKLPEAQRKRDHGYYYSRPIRYYSTGYHGFGRHGYKGRVVSRLPSQISRPFRTYGLPNSGGPSPASGHNGPAPTDNFINQETPEPVRNSAFIEESPIASQNNQPFGQDTANYLPPKNQKLPASSSPHVFSNYDNNFPRHQQQSFQPQYQQYEPQQQQIQPHQQQEFQQQQDYRQQQQDYQQQQQQQQDFEQQNNFYQQNFQQQQVEQFHQQTQSQFDNQDFRNQNNNLNQGRFGNQQISDATQFLSQNSQAISQLYGAPAPNEKYAPNNYDFQPNQEFEQNEQQQSQHQQNNQQSLNLQESSNDAEVQRYQAHQLPSYASGVLNTQSTQGNIPTLDQQRLIFQLQQALSQRENSGRLVHNLGSSFSQNSNLIISPQFPSPVIPASDQPIHHQSFLPSTTASTSDYQGFYATTPIITTTPAPLPSTTVSTSTTLHPSQGHSAPGGARIGPNFSVQGSLRPATVLNPSFGGFVPTFSILPAGTLLPSQSDDNAPTHFGIPLPGIQGQQRPVSPPPTTSKPVNTPTISIPLGPVNTLLPPLSKPQPVVPVTPIQSNFGVVNPSIVPPSFVYKPFKLYPVYYYPNVAYQPIRKLVSAAASAHPWNYAPSFAQRRYSSKAR